jgi:hypothetical protein
VDPEEIPRPARIDVDTAFASGALVVGSFHWGDLSHQEACRSLELFAIEAMPAVL